MTLNKRTVEIDAERLYRLEAELVLMKQQRDKLVALILLTDPVVSGETVNSLSVRQWAEFARWYKEKFRLDFPEVHPQDRLVESVSACQDSAHLAEV